MSSTGQSPRGTAIQLALGLGALGVVFGDIGTSPLYTLRECLNALPPAEHKTAVLGVLSLVFWSLILVVSVKYTVFVLKADNRGEGGILSLVVLVETLLQKKGGFVLALGIIGAAFFFGDAMITPAMSVMNTTGSNVSDKSFTAGATVVPALSA